MKLVRDEYLHLLTRRIEHQPRNFVQVIYGPRQVGKTTMVLQYKERTSLFSHYASANSTVDLSATWLSQQWETARLLTKTQSAEGLLIIDEIQKIKNWE